MYRSAFKRLMICGVVCAAVAVASAQQDSARQAGQERTNTTGYNAIIDNLDLLVDNYAKFLARKYDLTDEQDQYTKYLLRERAYSFLEKHEGDLRNLIDRMFEVRSGGDMSQDELVQWGGQAAPLYEEAKKLIIDGNNEWREILTPEQQKLHDEDVRLMMQSFETTEEQLNRITSGEMTVNEFRSPTKNKRTPRARTHTPQPGGVANSSASEPPPYEEIPMEDPAAVSPRGGIQKPPTVAERAAGQAGAPRVTPAPGRRESRVDRAPRPGEPTGAGDARNAAREARRGREAGEQGGRPGATPQKAETEWEKYVREFIEKYKLTDEQSQKAKAILEDCEKQKERYLQSKADEVELIDKQIAETQKSSDKTKNETLAKLNDRKRKMSEPVDQIFTQQLKPRLERLPTRAQRREAEEASKKKPADAKNKPQPPRQNVEPQPPSEDPQAEPPPDEPQQEPEPEPEPEPD